MDEKLFRGASKLALFNAAAGVDKHTVQDTERGTKLVLSVEIFKAATFKDSMGEQRTWTQEQLAAMAANFTLLRQADIFPNVPIRKDHGWSVEDIIGYIAEIRVEGDRLVADLEFTDDDGFLKFDNGTFRSRSLEVGMYEDNNGVTWWPVVFGLAFVDIPAVEGLHSGRRDQDKVHVYSQESAVPDKDDKQVTATDTKNASVFTFQVGGKDTTDYAAVQAHIGNLESERNELVSKYEASKGEVTALTTRVETLETAAQEQVKVGRANFVAKLAADKKIAQPQVAPLTGVVEDMTPEQFDKFCASYEAAPALSLFQTHADGVSNPDNANGAPDPRKDRIEVLQGIVAQHRRAGMGEDDVKNTSSFKELAQLTAAAS